MASVVNFQCTVQVLSIGAAESSPTVIISTEKERFLRTLAFIVLVIIELVLTAWLMIYPW